MGLLYRSFIKLVVITPPLWIAKITSILVGLFAMVLAFYQKNLLDLLQLIFAFSIPIMTAPYILAIYGFRTTSSTALIEMVSGIVSILCWDRWLNIKTKTGIDGSVCCMLVNGLTMLAVHYLFPQPEGTGWIPPDKTYQQRQQETVVFLAIASQITVPLRPVPHTMQSLSNGVSYLYKRRSLLMRCSIKSANQRRGDGYMMSIIFCFSSRKV